MNYMPSFPDDNSISLLLADYVVSLHSCSHLDHGFVLTANSLSELGFDGLVYSAMPRSLGKPGQFNPIFLSSSDFSDGFLQHYNEADLWQKDFTIERIIQGSLLTMDWSQELSSGLLTDEQSDVVKLAQADYGIHNAISIPTHSDQHVIAGASITSSDSAGLYNKLLIERKSAIEFIVHHFHRFVFSGSITARPFYQPLLENLSSPERRLLTFVASGKPLKQSKKYTDLSPSRAANILSKLYKQLNVANVAELTYLVGHHKVIEMLR